MQQGATSFTHKYCLLPARRRKHPRLFEAKAVGITGFIRSTKIDLISDLYCSCSLSQHQSYCHWCARMLEAAENRDLLITERENFKAVVWETEKYRQLHVNSFESQGRLLRSSSHLWSVFPSLCAKCHFKNPRAFYACRKFREVWNKSFFFYLFSQAKTWVWWLLKWLSLPFHIMFSTNNDSLPFTAEMHGTEIYIYPTGLSVSKSNCEEQQSNA